MKKAAVVDTETTGLPDHGDVRLVSIAIVDLETGSVLLDTLIQPKVPGENCYPIPARATQIHKISDEDVRDAPDWGEVRQQLIGALVDYGVLWSYNVDFDAQVIRGHDEAWCRVTGDEPLRLFKTYYDEGMVRTACAMEWFADPWNYGSRARWSKLWVAAKEAGHDWRGASAHGALADALACRSVILYLAQKVRRGIPCHMCGQLGRPYNDSGSVYCKECLSALGPMVDAFASTPGMRHWSPSKATWKRAMSRVAAKLDDMGLTVPQSWFDEVWIIFSGEM